MWDEHKKVITFAWLKGDTANTSVKTQCEESEPEAGAAVTIMAI